MRAIDEQIRWYEENASRKDDDYIKANLKLINDLFEEIEDTGDRMFIDKIIGTFCEIMEVQREVIKELEYTEALRFKDETNRHNFVVERQVNADDIPWDFDEDYSQELPSYMPPQGGFQNDNQVKKAFTNFLTYHIKKKTKDGRERQFSIHTIYDYCSRIKVLWESFYHEWKAGSLEIRVQLNDECLVPESTFLNAYRHIYFLEDYVNSKERQSREIASGLRDPLSEEEMKKTPLNNPRNLGNTVAALMKFVEFKCKIDKCGG